MEGPGICFVKVTWRLRAGAGVYLPGRRVVPVTQLLVGLSVGGGSVHV